MSTCIQTKFTYYGVSKIYKAGYAGLQIYVARKRQKEGRGNAVTYNGL